MKTKTGKRLIRYAIPVVRIIIGMAFFLTGLAKIIDLRGFQKAIEAFALFSEGYTPTSPEVKELGLHASNRYEYSYD